MSHFRVHHCRFFDYLPQAIHCLAYEEVNEKLAVSRADGTIEIWSKADSWYQERVIPSCGNQSVEALVWYGSRLFSAGLEGSVVEYDLEKLTAKKAVSSHNGPIWCMTMIQSGTKTQIAGGTEEGCVVLFDVTKDDIEYCKALDKQEGRILSVAWFAPDDLIVTGGMDNIRVWSRSSGHAIQRITLARQDKNKETIVWALAVTQDFTIISGDSRGKTSFWNGNQGTLIKAYQSHQADVLTLCVNKEGTSVVCSGVDPLLQHYEYISESGSDWKRWVAAGSLNPHSHDVRAITLVNDMVVSGGVDCHLVVSSYTSSQPEKTKVSKMGLIPQKSLVMTAPAINAVLLHYPDKLELWQLGSTVRTSEKNGEVLPLKTNPVKLIQIKAKEGVTIVSCAISKDGKRLAYSDQSSVRMFSLNITDTKIGAPTVTLKRIKPVQWRPLPAQDMTFSASGSCLILAAFEGSIQVVTFTSDSVTLSQTLPRPEGTFSPVHQLAVSPNEKLLAVGRLDNNISVFHLQKGEHLKVACSLPKFSKKPTSIAFSPSSEYIIVAYSDRKIMEFDITKKVYTEWSRELNNSTCMEQKKLPSKICKIWYNPCSEQQVMFHTDQKFCILDKSIPLSTKEATPKKHQRAKKNQEKALKICSRYKYLMHMDSLSEDYLVAVERTPIDIMDTLPPVLKQKKFGT